MTIGRPTRVISVSFVFASVLTGLPFSVLSSSVVSEFGENWVSVRVYVVSLDGVGNYRASNNSMVVEGAMQVPLDFNREIPVYLEPISSWEWETIWLNITYDMRLITDYEAYRMLIEWGSNAIVVNTHDEYLPVPSGYTKEEWAGTIADFMLNRWGTWTHTGGYPFYRVWHQDGKTEIWGEKGFQTLMSHIGKGNVTCYPPAKHPEKADFGLFWARWRFLDNCGLDLPASTLGKANPGYPISFEDFNKSQIINYIYVLNHSSHATGASIPFRQDASTLNFGVYVHLGAWEFYDGTGHRMPGLDDLAMRFISTAAALEAELVSSVSSIYWASKEISTAQSKGRTVGLDRAEALLQNATNAFDAENYKLAYAYAQQARELAEKAAEPNLLPYVIGAIAITVASIGVGAYYKNHQKRTKQEEV